MKRVPTNDPETDPRNEPAVGPDLSHTTDKDMDDSEDGYRPFFWYNKDYNIPDECRFYK